MLTFTTETLTSALVLNLLVIVEALAELRGLKSGSIAGLRTDCEPPHARRVLEYQKAWHALFGH